MLTLTAEKSNFKKSFIISIILHAILIFIASFTFLKENPVLIPKTTYIAIEFDTPVPVDALPKKVVKKRKGKRKPFRKPTIADKSQPVYQDPKPVPVKKRSSLKDFLAGQKNESINDKSSSSSLQEQASKAVPENSEDNTGTANFEKKGALTETDVMKMSQLKPGKMVMGNQRRGVIFEPPKPEYPEWAKKMGLESKVFIKFWVSPLGTVSGAEVINSSGYTKLDIDALNYIQKFRFTALPGASEEYGYTYFIYNLD